MKNCEVLYKIKTLEKLIIRNFINGINNNQNMDCISNHLTPTQMQILEYILENNGKPIYQRDLENILNLRRATVSGVLQTMEKNELIERITDYEDARIKQVILTQKAKTIFDDNQKKLHNLENIIINDISKNDLEIFLNVLDTMMINLKNK